MPAGVWASQLRFSTVPDGQLRCCSSHYAPTAGWGQHSGKTRIATLWAQTLKYTQTHTHTQYVYTHTFYIFTLTHFFLFRVAVCRGGVSKANTTLCHNHHKSWIHQKDSLNMHFHCSPAEGPFFNMLHTPLPVRLNQPFKNVGKIHKLF